MKRILIFVLLLVLASAMLPYSSAQSPLAVEVTRNIPYATPLSADARERQLDVYAPAEPGDYPAVVMLHAAGGSKNTRPMGELSQLIAEQGAVVFNVSISREDGFLLYQQGENGAGVRKFLEEGLCAVRFARAMAPQYGGRGDRVIVFGHSGGGYIGLWLALVGDDLAQVWDAFAAERGGPPRQVGCVAGDDVSGHPDAVVTYAGAMVFFDAQEFVDEDPELQQVLTPRTYIGGSPDVDLRFVFGNQDDHMPDFAVDWSKELYDLLAEARYDITWTDVEGTGDIPMEGPSFDMLLGTIVDVFSTQGATAMQDANEHNRTLVRAFVDAVNSQDYAVLDDLLTEDFQRHSVASPAANATSREEMKAFLERDEATFPDLQNTIQMMSAEGDLVAVHAMLTGTMEGPMGDIPATGNSIEVPFMSFFRIEDGRIAEMWVEWDNVYVLMQLGLFPPPSN